MTLRRPVWALHVLIVGLALHNLVMALLWRAGVRGTALTVVAAWKDVLLVGALALVVAARRGLPFKASASDWLALAFGALSRLAAGEIRLDEVARHGVDRTPPMFWRKRQNVSTLLGRSSTPARPADRRPTH